MIFGSDMSRASPTSSIFISVSLYYMYGVFSVRYILFFFSSVFIITFVHSSAKTTKFISDGLGATALSSTRYLRSVRAMPERIVLGVFGSRNS